MDSIDLTQLLAQSQPFRGLPAAELRAVLQAAQRRHFERDAFIYYQGDPASILYILTQGEAKLTQVTPEGHQMLVRFARPGDCFGCIAALSDAVYTLSAQAVDDCLALAWDGRTVAQLMERYPRISLNVLQLVAEYYRRLLDRYQELLELFRDELEKKIGEPVVIEVEAIPVDILHFRAVPNGDNNQGVSHNQGVALSNMK